MVNDTTNRLRELGRIAKNVRADSSSEIVIKEATFDDEEEVTQTALQCDYTKAPELYSPREQRPSDSYSGLIGNGSNAVVQILTILPPAARVIGLLAILVVAAGTYLAVRIWG